jgi:hypothetical protein
MYKLGHQVFFMVAYDGACSPKFLSERREFSSTPCFAKKQTTNKAKQTNKLYDSLRLDVEILCAA